MFKGERGAAYVEFLLAFVPLFVLFLGIAQVSLLFGARLLVQHAAERAARAAAVVLPDDPRNYGGESVGAVDGRGIVEQDLIRGLSRGGVGVASGELRSDEPAPAAPSRRSEVTLAAALTLFPLAPRTGVSIGSALGSDGIEAGVRHTLENLEVVVSREGPDAIVRVTYEYECVVPVARALVCAGAEKALTYEARATIQDADIEYPAWWTG